ncbi:hypothetical protein VE02_10161 [Pseudogymnoascus sp. 03VT05]|nr:hypothetical protein VE02_10161 [Pseudogymnoascus sp. 03VT05]
MELSINLSTLKDILSLFNVTTGQQICAGASGGSYVPPPVTNGTSDTGGQERGGPGGEDPTAVTGTTVSYLVTSQVLGANPTAAPAPTQNDITPAELYEWNTGLGVGGANCTTNLWVGYYYCIGTDVLVSTTTTSSSFVSTSTAVSAPTATQSGIISTCNDYAQAPSGSYCSLFASNNGITEAELYAWNTVLGTDGANCGTSFWAEEYYCIGVNLATASTTTSAMATATAVAAPGPTQAGIVSNCNGYAMAPTGSYCSLFASDNAITEAELYA